MTKVKKTILSPHRGDCYFASSGREEWIVDEVRFLDRDVLHRRRHRGICRRFLIYRCNDPRCDAQLIVLETDVNRLLGLNS